MYIFRKYQCWKHFIFVCSRHRDVCPFFTFALLFQLKFSHHHFSAMAPINFSATPPQFMERKKRATEPYFSKILAYNFNTFLLSLVSCLTSHVSCLRSHISHLCSHVSCLTFLSHISCFTTPVSRVSCLSCLLSLVSCIHS